VRWLVSSGVFVALAAAAVGAPSAAATERPAVGRSVVTSTGSWTFSVTLVGPMPFGPAGDLGQLTANCTFWLPDWPTECGFSGKAGLPGTSLRRVTDKGTCTVKDAAPVGPDTLTCRDARTTWRATVIGGVDVRHPVQIVNLVIRGRGSTTRYGLYSLP